MFPPLTTSSPPSSPFPLSFNISLFLYLFIFILYFIYYPLLIVPFREVQALASASVNMQFEKLKSDFEKKMKMHEQVLMEKLELMEAKTKKAKPK